MSDLEAQKATALELIQALVYRQDEKANDLCNAPSPTYSSFIGVERLPALDDLADSPAMRMKALLDAGYRNGAWSPLSTTTLDHLLESRLKAFGTSNMCSDRILAIIQRENVCAIRFQEVNRTAALEKVSTIRLHFAGGRIDAIDEYIDSRKSFGFERAVGVEHVPRLSPVCASA